MVYMLSEVNLKTSTKLERAALSTLLSQAQTLEDPRLAPVKYILY